MEEVRQDPAARPEYKIHEGKLYRHILHTMDFKETSGDGSCAFRHRYGNKYCGYITMSQQQDISALQKQ